MIIVSVPQKEVILSFFKEDIEVVKKYFNAIGFDFDDTFKYDAFKEFIFAAAGMFKDLDMGIYNKELVSKFQTIKFIDTAYSHYKKKSQFAYKVYQNDFLNAQESYKEQKEIYNTLKAEIQLLILKEQELFRQKERFESTLKEDNFKSKEKKETFLNNLKAIRRSHVDTVHILGTKRHELNELQELLDNFESANKAEFLEKFNEIKEKLDFQFTQILNYFGFEFNQALFKNSRRSNQIQKFQKESNIKGELDICKYLEYYLRNVNSEMLSDPVHKEKLRVAKEYCNRQKEKSELF